MTTVAPSIWRRVRHTRLRDALRGRFDASLDWRLLVAESQLPAEVNALIENVVKGTRLWRQEKVSVAAELIAHFQDGLEAGGTPDDLVRSFGDPQQTAQLIRRAKRRGRPLMWQLIRYGCWTVGACVVLYLLAGLWMLMDRPSVKVDYLALVNERAASVPEKVRAWPVYREALLAMDAKQSDDTNSAFIVAANSKPGDERWAATEEFLRRHESSIKKIREAASMPGLGFQGQTLPAALDAEDRKLFGITVTPEQIEAAKNQTVKDHWVIATLIPHVSFLKNASQLLANDARRAAASGDGETALQDVRAMFGIGRQCTESPFLVSLIVAETIQHQARTVIQDVLRERPDVWTNGQLRDLAHMTAAARVDWRRGFEGERASFYDSMQRIYTDNGNGDGRIALNVDVDTTSQANFFELLNSVTQNVSSASSSNITLSNTALAILAMPATNMVVASRKEMTETYDRYADRAMQQLEAPLWEQKDSPSIDEQLTALQADTLGQFRYLFVNLLMPAFDALRTRAVTAEGQRDGALIGIALELYHRENEKWPSSLAELSPRWLPEMPVDRITGKPLKLSIVDDRPIVYSVGVDGDDDGGQLPKYFAEGEFEYTVGPEYTLDPNATEHMKDQYDGDWVVWSTQ
jgi:hypothetical protein